MEENRALLTVSFGTAAEEARREEIGGVEEALRRRVPELPFARAYTSPTIRRILANRGIAVPSLEEALEEQLSAGVEQLYLLPTHLLPGYEYDAIAATVESFRPRFRDLRLAPPLMGDTDMVRALAGVLMERWRKLLGQTVVLENTGIFEETGGELRPLLSETGKTLVLQKIAQDSRGALTVALSAQGGQPLAGNLGKQTGYIQAAVRSQAPQDGLRRGYTSAATRGKKGHVITLQTGFGCFIIGSGSIIHGFGARVKPEMHEKGDGLSSRPPHHAKVQIT